MRSCAAATALTLTYRARSLWRTDAQWLELTLKLKVGNGTNMMRNHLGTTLRIAALSLGLATGLGAGAAAEDEV